jgi:hypothetical protein
MWPQLLFDLLPHFARLLPVADKYLTTRSASDKAHEAALGAMGESVRGELAEVKEAQAGLERQLREQGEQIAVDVARARMGIESVEARVVRLEKTAGMVVKLLVLVLLLAAMALAIVVVRKV